MGMFLETHQTLNQEKGLRVTFVTHMTGTNATVEPSRPDRNTFTVREFNEALDAHFRDLEAQGFRNTDKMPR